MSSRQIAIRQSAAITVGRVRQDLIQGNFDIVFKAMQDVAQSSSRDDMSAVFHGLVQACAKAKQPFPAAWCITAIVKLGLRPDRFMFNVAMDTCAKVGDLKLATKLWQEMDANGIQPNAVSYNTMIHAYAKARDGPKAEDWIQRMSFEGFTPCIVSFSSVISAFAKVGKYAKAEEWYGKMSAAGIDADVIIYNSLINACAQGGCPDRAKNWFTKMVSVGMSVDDTTYNSLIYASAKLGDVKTAEYWMNEMIRSKKTLSTITFGSVLHACAKAYDVDRAEYWMHVLIDFQLTPNVVCFNSVLHACAQKGEYARALRWFSTMSSVGVQPTRISYNFIIDAYSRAGLLDFADAWLNRMVSAGFHADAPCYISLIRALKQVDADKAMNPKWQYENSTDDSTSLQAHYLIIAAYARARKLDLIRSHFKPANICEAQRVGDIFHEELKEICLASGGQRFVSSVFDLLGVPIDACPSNSNAKGALSRFAKRPMPSPPCSFHLSTKARVQNESIPHSPPRFAQSVQLKVPVEEDSVARSTSCSYMTLEDWVTSDQESLPASGPPSERDEKSTTMRMSMSTTPRHAGRDNSQSGLSDEAFFLSAMCFSL